MSDEQAKQFLLQGINAARSGQKDEARKLIQNALRLDPQNETAWIWMSSVAKDNRERLFCLQNVLQINPENEMALKGVRALGVDPQQLLARAQQATQGAQAGDAPAATDDIPGISAERLNAILNGMDRFIQEYHPLPAESDEEMWFFKEGTLRYGEGLAIRRRNTRYALIGAGVVGFLLLLGLLFTLVAGGDDGGIGVAARATLTPSFTPSATATATLGVTNTPSPEPQNVVASATIPPNLPRGNIFEATSTPYYPAVPPGLGREFQNAVNLYSIGEYEPAFEVFTREREAQTIGCAPEAYFYHILGLSELGGRRNLEDAKALYEEAQNVEGCADNPMIYAAACVVDYLTFLDTREVETYDNAVGWCDASLAGVRTANPYVVAVTTRARLYMLEEPPNYIAAANQLDQALTVWPADLNLLLVRARVEINRGNLSRALNFIQQALYVDPVSEPALRLRVEAYLDIAALTEDDDDRIQLYGTAVLWAQEYLLFYAGDPAGYLLLARARFGEENYVLALDALTRIIEARADLTGAEEIINRAYLLRSQIFLAAARYEEALTDTEALLQADPDNPIYVEQFADIAYETGSYALVLEGIDELLNNPDYADRTDLRMRQLRILSQICEFEVEIDCDYAFALETLTDNFIAGLEPADAALALGYRAKALYNTTLAADNLTPNEQTVAFQNALRDIDNAIAADDTAHNRYYKGLILEALDENIAARLTYDVVIYWSQFYDYPFIEDVQARIDALDAAEES